MNKEEALRFFREKFMQISHEEYTERESWLGDFIYKTSDMHEIYFKPKSKFPKKFEGSNGYRYEIAEDGALFIIDNMYRMCFMHSVGLEELEEMIKIAKKVRKEMRK